MENGNNGVNSGPLMMLNGSTCFTDDRAKIWPTLVRQLKYFQIFRKIMIFKIVNSGVVPLYLIWQGIPGPHRAEI